MKHNLLIAATVSTFLTLCSFNAIAQTTTDQSNAPAANGQATMAPNEQESHILSIIEQIDKNEINAANVAISKTGNSDVKDFADDMKSDHQKNLEDAQDLTKKLNLNFTSSPNAQELQKKGEAGLKSLASLQGAEFDKAYMDAMVKGHTEALAFLNMVISKTANANLDSDFVDFLKDTQKTVTHHLEDAKEVQAKLK